MAVGNLPDHRFVSAMTNDDPQAPDAVCHAVLVTAREEIDGYTMRVQCGHTRAEHSEV